MAARSGIRFSLHCSVQKTNIAFLECILCLNLRIYLIQKLNKARLNSLADNLMARSYSINFGRLRNVL